MRYARGGLHIAENTAKGKRERNKQGELQRMARGRSVLNYFVFETISMHKIEAQNVFYNVCVVSVLLNNLNYALFKYNYNLSFQTRTGSASLTCLAPRKGNKGEG